MRACVCACVQFLASSILNTDSLRAVVAGFQVDAANHNTEQEILNLIEQQYRVSHVVVMLS